MKGIVSGYLLLAKSVAVVESLPIVFGLPSNAGPFTEDGVEVVLDVHCP